MIHQNLITSYPSATTHPYEKFNQDPFIARKIIWGGKQINNQADKQTDDQHRWKITHFLRQN